MSEVLLVDDDDDHAELVALLLERRGHRVRRAVDGRDGLARLCSERWPDVIVLDVEMPRLSGPEMAHAVLVHDAGLERIPVVLVSGVVGLAAVARAVGTPYFLSKPVSSRQLLGTLELALRERIGPAPDEAA